MTKPYSPVIRAFRKTIEFVGDPCKVAHPTKPNKYIDITCTAYLARFFDGAWTPRTRKILCRRLSCGDVLNVYSDRYLRHVPWLRRKNYWFIRAVDRLFGRYHAAEWFHFRMNSSLDASRFARGSFLPPGLVRISGPSVPLYNYFQRRWNYGENL